jgi:phage shock protein C
VAVMSTTILNDEWTRSENGWIAGVCQALGERFDINPTGIRILWLISVCFFGIGFLAYFIIAFCVPVKSKYQESLKPKFLGVCYRLSQRLELDLGLLRILTVLIAIGSMGTTILAYIVIHFLIPKEVVNKNQIQ